LRLSLDEAKTDDIKTTANGIDIMISKGVRGYAEGKMINYIDEPGNEGFTIGRAGYSAC
jgi:hypothetical protein